MVRVGRSCRVRLSAPLDRGSALLVRLEGRQMTRERVTDYGYAPALYTNRTVLRWYARVVRFRLKHGATLRGAWREARYIRCIQRHTDVE